MFNGESLRVSRRLWPIALKPLEVFARETGRDEDPVLCILSGKGANTVLWISLGLTTLFVFITSEVFLIADYPMYHAYRLQEIADRHLLIPHTICGTTSFAGRPCAVFVADTSPSLEIPSPTRPHVRHLRLYRRRHRNRPGGRPPWFARNFHAGRRLDCLHLRRRRRRA